MKLFVQLPWETLKGDARFNCFLSHMKATPISIILIASMFLQEANSQTIQTLTLQPGPDDGKDAWVWSGERTKDANFGIEQSYNQGLHNVIRAEVWKWFGQSESDTIRSFIHFDLSGIPDNSIVIEATLSLYYYANPGFTPQLGENSFEITLVREAWEEDIITWTNQPKVKDDFKVRVDKSSELDQSYLNIDIRNLIQEIVYVPSENNGMRLALVQELPYNGLTFASSDHADAGLRPKLSVRYKANQ